MLPSVYGFTWDTGNIIFLGAFYSIVALVLSTMTIAIIRARRNTSHAEAIRWKEEFSALPVHDRACRHELSGEIGQRTCPNGFDCRVCANHPHFLARSRNTTPGAGETSDCAAGFTVPGSRLYHRGHTWIEREDGGVYRIGLDDFGQRLIGSPDSLQVPKPGTRLTVNGTAWRMRKNGHPVRILSPIDGIVVESGKELSGWLLRVKPLQEPPDLTHLLGAQEVTEWLQREVERLELSLPTNEIGATLADGGVMVADPAREMPEADWDAVYGEMFLEP